MQIWLIKTQIVTHYLSTIEIHQHQIHTKLTASVSDCSPGPNEIQTCCKAWRHVWVTSTLALRDCMEHLFTEYTQTHSLLYYTNREHSFESRHFNDHHIYSITCNFQQTVTEHQYDSYNLIDRPTVGSNVAHWAEYTWPHCWVALAVRPEDKKVKVDLGNFAFLGKLTVIFSSAGWAYQISWSSAVCVCIYVSECLFVWILTRVEQITAAAQTCNLAWM